MTQELLVTFEQDYGGVTLVPGTGGIFEVRLDGALIWSRAEQARFPEIKELKRLARDRTAPHKDMSTVGGTVPTQSFGSRPNRDVPLP